MLSIPMKASIPSQVGWEKVRGDASKDDIHIDMILIINIDKIVINDKSINKGPAGPRQRMSAP
jgi:hypothetical protein